MAQNFLQFLRNSETESGMLGATFDASISGMQPQIAGTREAGAAEYAFNPQALTEGQGYGSPTKAMTSKYGTQYREAVDAARGLVDAALSGSRWHMWKLQEAMTTSDFPLLFGDVLDRSVLANYAETPYTWDMYCARKILNDFR